MQGTAAAEWSGHLFVVRHMLRCLLPHRYIKQHATTAISALRWLQQRSLGVGISNGASSSTQATPSTQAEVRDSCSRNRLQNSAFNARQWTNLGAHRQTCVVGSSSSSSICDSSSTWSHHTPGPHLLHSSIAGIWSRHLKLGCHSCSCS